jgi:hypothetical protein
MNNWAAPLIVFTLGLTAAIIIGEPVAAILTTALAVIGYTINKEAN